MNNDIKT